MRAKIPVIRSYTVRPYDLIPTRFTKAGGYRVIDTEDIKAMWVNPGNILVVERKRSNNQYQYLLKEPLPQELQCLCEAR